MNPATRKPEYSNQAILEINSYPDLTATEEAMAKIFDDIDTAFDAYSPKMNSFENYVLRKIEEAKKLYISDGYILKKRI